MPLGELQDNTTADLVSDMEKLRTHLGIQRWLLFGGSWGSTLALAYGLAHPDRTAGFVLRGIFLGARPEIDWFLHGMRTIFPEAWRDFAEHLPEDERSDLLGNYYRRLVDRNPDRHRPAARAWSRYEAACSTLYPTVRAPFETDHGGFALALSRIEAHYFAHGTFLPEGWPWAQLERVRHLPCTIVQGRYDIVCPPVTADALARAAAWLARERPELHLRVLDAARPQRVQELFWAHVKGTPMQPYFAPPERGSIHSFGMAVDLTLGDAQGQELDMGTPFDDTTELSHPALEHEHAAAGHLSAAQIDNRRLLRTAMLHADWQAIASEWWHFDFGDRLDVRSRLPRIV